MSNYTKSHSSSGYKKAYIFVWFCMFLGVSSIIASQKMLVPVAQSAGSFISTPIVTLPSFSTDMVFLPSDDILVTQKGSGDRENSIANIWLIKNGVVQAEPVLSLSVNAFWEMGLSSIVLDPNFASNGYFYLRYVTGAQAKEWDGVSRSRVSRFTYDELTGKASLASEVIIHHGIPSGDSHQGHTLVFGNDGYLYIAFGDNGQEQLVQSMDSLVGKVIRVRPTDTGSEIPDDNPFVGVNGTLPEIYASGFRNPFKMIIRPSDGAILVGDVGAEAWEEVNVLVKGANYGHPLREGPCPHGLFRPCASASSQYTDPVFAYEHIYLDESDPFPAGSITGLAYYQGNAFPSTYQNQLFISDYALDFLKTARLDLSYNTLDIPVNVSAPLDLEYRHNGLYLLNTQRTIEFISYSTAENIEPQAQISAISDLLAPAPHAVEFTAEGSYDPDGISLTYHWDFGDGTKTTSSAPLISHTYTVDGLYQTSLYVEDVFGAVSTPVTVDVTVYSGELPEIGLSFTNSITRTQYHGGDEVVFTVERSTMADLDNVTPYSWQVNLRHNDHIHPVIDGLTTVSGTYTIPTSNHDSDWNLTYEHHLTMLTDSGLEVVISDQLFPETHYLDIDTEPLSVDISVNGINRTTPYSMQAISGVTQTISATTAEILYGQSIGGFTYWHWFPSWDRQAETDSIGLSTDNPLVFAMPAEDRQYVGRYAYLRPAELSFIPLIQK